MLKQEKENRRQARQNLLPFIKYTFPKYQIGSHHRKLAEALEAVERGDIDRLMVTMPPRHGKSEQGTIRYPAWCLGRNPEWQVICASYNAELASDFGRKVRNNVADPKYQALFETRLANDSKAANRWNTHRGGAYVAVGVGGSATGRGADLFIIDDPLKDREEADSEVQRQKVWDWYTSTAYTRLMPGGRVVVIQTRWHEDDLSGRLLEQMGQGGDTWTCIDMPAIDEGNQPLWPERYSLEALQRIKAAIGNRDWSALYQQKPSPDDGDFFKREWFHMYQPEELPKALNMYGTSDYAVTADGGDFTVIADWGLSKGDDVWLVGGWYGKTTSDIWIEEQLDHVKRHKPLAWFSEKGVIQKAIEPMLTKRMRERRAFVRLEWLPSIHDKATRARAFQSRASMGLIHLPDNDFGHWILDQLLKFPVGKHDDGVDVCSLIGQAIDQAHPAVASVVKSSPVKPKGYSKHKRKKGGAGWR